LIYLILIRVCEFRVHRACGCGCRKASIIFELHRELSLAITDIVLVEIVIEIIARVLSIADLLVLSLIGLLSLSLTFHILKNAGVFKIMTIVLSDDLLMILLHLYFLHHLLMLKI
jgi:hypothetical protein